MKKFIITGLTAASLSFSGLAFAEVAMDTPSKAELTINSIATKKAKEMLDARLASLPEPLPDMISYEDVAVDLAAETMIINNVTISELGNIKEIVLVGNFHQDMNRIPEDIEMTISELSIDDDFSQAILRNAPSSLQNSTYSLYSKWSYDADKHSAQIDSKITADGILSLSSDWVMSDISSVSDLVEELKGQEPTGSQVDQALDAIKFASFKVSVNNEGALKPLVNELLAQNNITNDELISFLQLFLEEDMGNEVEDILESLLGFVTNWNKFELSITLPNGGMTAQEIENMLDEGLESDPFDLLNQLKLESSGN